MLIEKGGVGVVLTARPSNSYPGMLFKIARERVFNFLTINDSKESLDPDSESKMESKRVFDTW